MLGSGGNDMNNDPRLKPDNELSEQDFLKVFFGLFGVSMTLIGITFAKKNEMYYSCDFMGIPIEEGKYSEHDAMLLGIAMAVIGFAMVIAFLFLHFRGKSKPSK